MNIEQLGEQAEAKFREIMALVVEQLGPDVDAVEETQTLLENWTDALAEDQPPKVTTKLQRLLAESHEIYDQILEHR